MARMALRVGLAAGLVTFAGLICACFAPNPTVSCAPGTNVPEAERCPPGYSCEPGANCGSNDWSEPDGARFVGESLYNVDLVDLGSSAGFAVLGTANLQVHFFTVDDNTITPGDETTATEDAIKALRATSVGVDNTIAVTILREDGLLAFARYARDGAIAVDMTTVPRTSVETEIPTVVSNSLAVHSFGAAGALLFAAMWQEQSSTATGEDEYKTRLCILDLDGAPQGNCPLHIDIGSADLYDVPIEAYSAAMSTANNDATITYSPIDRTLSKSVVCSRPSADSSPTCVANASLEVPALRYADLQRVGATTYWWTGVAPASGAGFVGRKASNFPTASWDENVHLGPFVVASALNPNSETRLGFIYSAVRTSGTRDLYFRCAVAGMDMEVGDALRLTSAAGHDATTPRLIWSSQLGRFVTAFSDTRSGDDALYYEEIDPSLSGCQ